jgi:hypothetical protein
MGYLEAGLAVIAGDHPAYCEMIVSKENGYLVINPGDFNTTYDNFASQLSVRTLTKEVMKQLCRNSRLML